MPANLFEKCGRTRPKQMALSSFWYGSVFLLVLFLVLSLLALNWRLHSNESYASNRLNSLISQLSSQNTTSFLRTHITNTSKEIFHQRVDIPNNRIDTDLIRCRNQTLCISPQLQLRPTFNVYFCKHINFGIRFFFLVREGLLLHPKIRLVHSPQAADYIIYLPESSRWEKTECALPELHNKTIVLDESDYPNLFEPSKEVHFLLSFKRSYVQRSDGRFKHYMNYVTDPTVFPMTYTLAEIYIRHLFKRYQERTIDILCSLRAIPSDPTRTRVKKWIDEYISLHGLSESAYSGEVNSMSRPVISKQYFERMYSSKIIVTSNPSNWEGDFRLCEALATGALIFVDEMYVPRQKPFIHGKHVIYYNSHNKSDLFQKLDYYLSQPDVSKKIAEDGYLHAMKYHRAANLIDYVFRTLDAKLTAERENKMDLLLHNPDFASKYQYEETGYALRLQAIQLQKSITARGKSGNLKFQE
jgi:hypothetical protein